MQGSSSEFEIVAIEAQGFPQESRRAVSGPAGFGVGGWGVEPVSVGCLGVCRAVVLCPGRHQQGWQTHVKAALGQTTGRINWTRAWLGLGKGPVKQPQPDGDTDVCRCHTTVTGRAVTTQVAVSDALNI